jgi:hypothetical protein
MAIAKRSSDSRRSTKCTSVQLGFEHVLIPINIPLMGAQAGNSLVHNGASRKNCVFEMMHFSSGQLDVFATSENDLWKTSL